MTRTLKALALSCFALALVGCESSTDKVDAGGVILSVFMAEVVRQGELAGEKASGRRNWIVCSRSHDQRQRSKDSNSHAFPFGIEARIEGGTGERNLNGVAEA